MNKTSFVMFIALTTSIATATVEVESDQVIEPTYQLVPTTEREVWMAAIIATEEIYVNQHDYSGIIVGNSESRQVRASIPHDVGALVAQTVSMLMGLSTDMTTDTTGGVFIGWSHIATGIQTYRDHIDFSLVKEDGVWYTTLIEPSMQTRGTIPIYISDDITRLKITWTDSYWGWTSSFFPGIYHDGNGERFFYYDALYYIGNDAKIILTGTDDDGIERLSVIDVDTGTWAETADNVVMDMDWLSVGAFEVLGPASGDKLVLQPAEFDWQGNSKIYQFNPTDVEEYATVTSIALDDLSQADHARVLVDSTGSWETVYADEGGYFEVPIINGVATVHFHDVLRKTSRPPYGGGVKGR